MHVELHTTRKYRKRLDFHHLCIGIYIYYLSYIISYILDSVIYHDSCRVCVERKQDFRAHLVSAVTFRTINRQLERSIYLGCLQGQTFVSNTEGGRDFAP